MAKRHKGENKSPPSEYYVYEWFRVSDGHVFYVGKGSGDRVLATSPTHRNIYFIRFYNKYECDYRIVSSGLTEKEAYILENEIHQKRKANGECECNISDTSLCNGGSALKGNLNGMYGKTHSPEVVEKLRKINSDGRNKGENNAQYGVSPKERMSEEIYSKWREKQRARKDGNKNPNSHNVLMANVITGEHLIFEATVECADYLLNNLSEFAERYNSIEKLRYVIKHSNKTSAIYFNWMFVIYNKKKPINIDDTVSTLCGRNIRKIPVYERETKKDVTTTENIDKEKDFIE